MDITTIETHFQAQRKLLGNLADPEEFDMIFYLIDKVNRLQAESDKLTALNRHYFFKFYDGIMEKATKDNSYLLGD